MGKYLIILHGSVPPTVEGQEQLRARLINELGCEPDAVETIFNSLPAILQNSLEASEAEDYLKVLQAFGGDVEMLEASDTGEFLNQDHSDVPLLGDLALSQYQSSIASAGEGLLSLNSEESAMTDAFEVGTVEDSVSDLLNILDHELEEPIDSDDALLDFDLGQPQLSSEQQASPPTNADVVEDLGLGLWSDSDSLNFTQSPETPSTDTALAESSLVGAEEFADLEAELMEALAFGETEESEPESHDTSRAAAREKTPIEEEPVGFSFDSPDEAPLEPSAAVLAKPAQSAPAPSVTVKSEPEEEPSLFSFDDLEPIDSLDPSTATDTAASATAFFEEETGGFEEMSLAPVAPERTADVDPLEARMSSPTIATAAPTVAPVAPPEDDFKWPVDPAADNNSGAASFAAKHKGGGASAVPEAVAEVGKAAAPNRQKLLFAIAAIALLALGGVSLYKWMSRPTGFAINPESIDEMLKAQDRMNKARDKQAAKEAPTQRTWVGTAETGELNIRLEVATIADQLVNWHVVVTSPEPPPLTEEEFGTGVERPWMKRAEADGAYDLAAAPSGTTVGFEGPGRAYVQHIGGTARLSILAQGQVRRESDEKLTALIKIESSQTEDIALGKDGNGKLVVKRGADRRFVVKLTGEVPLIPGVSAKPKRADDEPGKASAKKKKKKKIKEVEEEQAESEEE